MASGEVTSPVACGGRKSQWDRTSRRGENITVSKGWTGAMTAWKGKQILSE